MAEQAPRHPSRFGVLYVVATPLGNLEDFSPRAVRVLREVDLVLAEDTRTFGKLAQRFGIQSKVWSYHEQNERVQAEKVAQCIADGQSVALTSDAGTPTISDPGFRLVAACRAQGLPVVTVPGPCALIAALSISGLPTDRFRFEGFLPVKEGKRREALAQALEETCPTIFYESPHRIVKTLSAIAEMAHDREVFVARELTKLHEEALKATAGALAEDYRNRSSIKGEFVLIISGAPKRARCAS
ncbi:MAG: 16S rRNA (cytidine(1402)-2'-O)-methyltransferase [Bdellovibrionales bacterium]|nr:16S rRNA (cytidine(1402)-2'-O)-methyltransferase [Bdellovibrionales bacterium]